MRIETSDPATIRGIFESIMVLQDEPKIRARPDGLAVRCMDPSRVALVILKVGREAFDLYECLEEKAFAVNLREVLKVLKRVDRGTKVALNLKEDVMEIEVHGRFLKKFGLPLLEGGEEEGIEDPKIEYSVKAIFIIDDFIEVLEDSSLASDVVKFEADENLIKITSKGEVNNMVAEITKGSDALLSLEAFKPASAYFSLSYLKDIVKAASKIADAAEISLATNMPIKIDFRTRFTGELRYYVAPRIEE